MIDDPNYLEKMPERIDESPSEPEPDPP